MTKPVDIHVTPRNDMKKHIDSRDCWCHPSLKERENKAIIVIHQSMDGRELIEKHGIN